MKKLMLILLLSVALVGCSNEQSLPQPGDEDFIGPLSEEQLKESLPQPGDEDFIGPLTEEQLEEVNK